MEKENNEIGTRARKCLLDPAEICVRAPGIRIMIRVLTG